MHSSAMPHAEQVSSLTDRFSNFYQQLSIAASDLNAASDGLSEPINALDQVLKNLNLGISMFNDNYTSRPTTIRFPGSGLI